MSQRPGLEFKERMSGWIGIGQKTFVEGRIAGQQENTPIRFDAHIIIDDLDRFIHQLQHQARLEGTVTFTPLGGGSFAMEDGLFNLFSVDPASGIRLMIYSFRFIASDGKPYFLYGEKHIKDDPGFDFLEDMTILFTAIHAGTDNQAPVYGAGQIFFDLKHVPALVATIRVTGTRCWELRRRIRAKAAFMDFVWGEVRAEYLRKAG